MFDKNIIKYFFIISCLIAISFPMVNIYHIFPKFSTLLSSNAEDESVHIAKNLSLMVIGEEHELEEPDSYVERLETAKEEFRLNKIKLFSSNGEIIYSTDPGNIGDINKNSYFHEIVAKGNTYSKLVQKETESLEGELMGTDMVETYVPIMKDGRFLGAFEIYFDITKQHGLMKRAVFNSSLISFTLMFSFFLITGILLLIEKKKTVGFGTGTYLKTYRSPLYLLLVSMVSIFIAEAIVMMLISFLPPISKPKEAIIDASLLVMIVAPALYFFLFHPLILHINKRHESENKIQTAYEKLYTTNTKLETEIAEREKMQEEIIQSKKDWEDTFDIMTDAITIHDKDFNIIKSNKSAEKFLDLPFSKDKNAKCYKYYHRTDCPIEDCPSCDCLKTGIPANFELYEPHLKKNIEIRAMPKFDSKNNIIGTIHVVRDITERKQMEMKLKTMSITDNLTGLYNRRGFFSMIEQQLKVLKRKKEKAFMLYIDIDNFKDINDTIGHNKGDSALVDAANILKSTYRESDIIARMGGDEFVIFPAGKKESHVSIVMGRLQANIDIYNAEKERGYTLSMSIGIASYDPGNPHSTDDLLAEADRSMSVHKRQREKT